MAIIEIPTNKQQEAATDITPLTLGSPIQPRFFWGQLLTDQDLTQLVDWVQDRFRLSRYRQGWGVVNGLSVTKNPNDQEPQKVSIGPGYAVSNWGDDIVVAEDTLFDLQEVFDLKQANCGNLVESSSAHEGDDIRLGGTIYPVKDICCIDLYVGYDETPTEPKATLGRNPHGQADVYENSRVQEAYEFTWEISEDMNPLATQARAWRKAYCDWISEQQPALDNQDSNHDRLLYLMHQYPNAPVSGISANNQADGRVPLARLWLQIGATKMSEVLAIDAYPPYRRYYGPEHLPIDATACDQFNTQTGVSVSTRTIQLPAPDQGQVNVAHLLWQRWESENQYQLAETVPGIDIHKNAQGVTPEEGIKLFKQSEVIFTKGQTLVACVVDMEEEDGTITPAGALGMRIVGFLPMDEAHPQPAPGEQTLQATSRVGDDLTQISGIRSTSADALRKAGLTTYAAVANATDDEVKAAFEAAGIRGRPIANIKSSAADLAKGNK